MASDATVVARMRAAQVPPQVWEKSLTSEKFLTLAEDFDQKKFQIGEGTVLSYVIKATDRKVSPLRSVLACYLIAKSLALKNRAVYCASMGELVQVANEKTQRETRMPEAGDGYIIVPDIISHASAFTQTEWLMAQAYLTSHVSRGGGLIIGVHDAVGSYDDTWLEGFTLEMQVILSGFERRGVR